MTKNEAQVRKYLAENNKETMWAMEKTMKTEDSKVKKEKEKSEKKVVEGAKEEEDKKVEIEKGEKKSVKKTAKK